MLTLIAVFLFRESLTALFAVPVIVRPFQEREVLLRTRNSGMSLYEDAPELPPTKSNSWPRSSPPLPTRRYGNTEWCNCKHCVVLDNGTEAECLCCRDMGSALTRVQPTGCIPEHPELSMLCLSIAMLRLLYFELRGHGHPLHEDIHRRYQYTAYRNFVCCLCRRLGRGNQMILPACVVGRIREEFSSETTTGFMYPR
ncbi:P2X purinoceptor 7-like [Ixodes scapularis]|uniref:P2X purinoceptor 7-like n=1 Tax=Ixodes scapularis TaxID=6945 RepID=UPI001A9EF8B4|nr:P2X purinoceptor 7-like [Ixodes scapularis]